MTGAVRLGLMVSMVALWCMCVAAGSVEAQRPAVRDSAGIRIVYNARPAAGTRVTFDSRPILQIGSVSGAGSTDFGVIYSARLIGDSLIAITDMRGREIRIFNAGSGAHVRTIGRAGRGPGEFISAPLVEPAAQGGLWAWDPGNRRITRFALDGSVVHESTLQPAQMQGMTTSSTLNTWQLTSAGAVLWTGSDTRPVGGSFVTDQAIALTGDGQSAPVRFGSAWQVRHVTDNGLFVPDPFLAPLAAVVSGSQIVVSRNGAWQLDVYTADGRLRQIIRSAVPRTRITAGLRAQERAALAERVPANAAAFTQLFDRIPFADSTSAIAAFRVDPDGTVWVRRWHSRLVASDQVFDLHDRNGTWLTTVRVPRSMGEIADVAGGRVLTVWRDDFDVVYLRVYRYRVE